MDHRSFIVDSSVVSAVPGVRFTLSPLVLPINGLLNVAPFMENDTSASLTDNISVHCLLVNGTIHDG